MSIVGNYRLISEIGQGSMGRVFLAEDMRDNRQVALKAMLGETNALQEKRFLREAQAMSKLSHPNIIKIYEVNKENNRYYFTMPYIEGCMLSELIAMKKLTTSRIIEITTKVAHAIHYAHENNLLHRDLKPSNIMIDSKGEPIVMDFGLAKQFRDTSKLSQTGEILGTPAYMSPEQARSNQQVDRRADVYSLGICFYEMLTGRVPFSGTKWQILAQLIHKKPTRPRQLNSQIHETLELICLKAIEKQKEMRFASALEFAEELQRFAAGKSSQIKKRLAASFMTWLEKYHLPVMGSLLIFLTAICFILFYERYSRNQSQICHVTLSPSTDLSPKQNSLKIHGKVEIGNYLRRVFINGQEHSLQDQHEFTKQIPVLYGKNIIDVVVLSQDHRWNNFTWEIKRNHPQNQAFFLGSTTNNARVHTLSVQQLQTDLTFTLNGYQTSGSAIACEDIVYFALRHSGLHARNIKDGTELWKFETNEEVRASPIVMNGRIYFSDYQNLYCLDMYDGTKQWQLEIDSHCRSLALDEETIFIGGREGKFFAVATDGTLRWEKNVVPQDARHWEDQGRDWGRDRGRGRNRGRRLYEFRGCPASYKDTIIATCSNGMVYCWKKNTGRTVWTFKANNSVRTSPIVIERTIYFGCDSGTVYGIDAENKQLKWQINVRRGVDSTPLVHRNTIYFGCEDNYVYAVDLQKKILKWETKVDSEIYSPIIVGDRLYCGSRSGYLYGFDLNSGQKLFEDKCAREIHSAPFVYNNKMLVTGEHLLKTFTLK